MKELERKQIVGILPHVVQAKERNMKAQFLLVNKKFRCKKSHTF